MKKLSRKKIVLIVAVAVTVILAILYFAAPPYLYQAFIRKQRADAGLTVKSADIPGFHIVYAEGGTGDTIVLLHGFGASKDSWLPFAKFLTSRYHVVIPDLPGFGESTKFSDDQFSIRFMVEKAHDFAEKLNLTRFNLAGHSMGGNIAGNFAVAYPDMVKTLALIDAARVISPVKSNFDLLMEKGINPYMIKNEKDFDRFMEFMYHKPPQIPFIVKNYMVKHFIELYAPYEKSFNDGWEKSIFPESTIKKISAPTLIIWGDTDNNFNLSCARIFEKNIRNSKLVVIEECGHVPIMEKPEETAGIYMDFLEKKTN